jgi:hypothetical protein
VKAFIDLTVSGLPLLIRRIESLNRKKRTYFAGSLFLSQEFVALCTQQAPPKLTVRGEPADKRIEKISLCKCKAAVIGKAFEVCIKSSTGFERRPLGPAVKIDVEFDLQLSDLVFDPRQLRVDLGRFFTSR